MSNFYVQLFRNYQKLIPYYLGTATWLWRDHKLQALDDVACQFGDSVRAFLIKHPTENKAVSMQLN